MRTVQAVAKEAARETNELITKEEQIMAFDCLQIMMACLQKRRNAYVENSLPQFRAQHLKELSDWKTKMEANISKSLKEDVTGTKIKQKLCLIALQYLGERVESHLKIQFSS